MSDQVAVAFLLGVALGAILTLAAPSDLVALLRRRRAP